MNRIIFEEGTTITAKQLKKLTKNGTIPIATLANCVFKKECVIPAHSSIGEYNIIGKRCTVGSDTHIGPFATIHSNTVLDNHIFLSSYSVVHSTVSFGNAPTIGEHCELGTYTNIGNYGRIRANVVFGNSSLFGSNCVFGKGTTIGAYSHVSDNAKFEGDNYIDTYTCIKDFCDLFKVTVGEYSTIGRNSKIRRCTLRDNCLLDYNSIQVAYGNKTGVDIVNSETYESLTLGQRVMLYIGRSSRGNNYRI